MEKFNKGVEMMFDAYRKEWGEDAKMEEGEEFSAVFNDGVITAMWEGDDLKLKVTAGEPFLFDHDLALLEKE